MLGRRAGGLNSTKDHHRKACKPRIVFGLDLYFGQKNYLTGYLENQIGITWLGLLLGIRLRL